MEFIIPSFEIWDQGYKLEDIWSHVARCTRVCYQSTPKNNGETDEEFVKRVILHNCEEKDFEKLHGAMLEHGTVYMQYKCKWVGDDFVEKYKVNPYSVVNYRNTDDYTPDGWKTSIFYITTNLRVIYENNWLDDLQYLCFPTKWHPLRITVSFNTNIGVTREYNRHRVNSIAEESTRYCNYSKKNDGHLKIGLPAWLLDEDNMEYIQRRENDELHSYCTDVADGSDYDWCDIDYYLFALSCAEYCYNNLIRKGWKPQQAREVLPLATKSQVIHTAFVDDWEHFFKLRAIGVSGPPHPNAKLLANPLMEKFIKRNYITKLD